MLRAVKCVAAVVCVCGMLLAAESSGLWLDVPFVKQTREGCGAASIAMVMQYWLAQAGTQPDDAADPANILQRLHSPQGHGIYASAMKKYLDDHGYRTFAFGGTWQDLEQHLRKGRPLIVALAPSANDKVLHYVVVAGVDDGFVLFNDPADRKLARLDRPTFERQWSATDNWTLLAVPQSVAH
jgi:predicted double-glycine peptidase